MLQGTAALMPQQLTEGQTEKLSPCSCRAGPGGAADRAAAVVHFASDEAGVPADRTALPRRPLHGLALRSSIAGRVADAGSASPSCLENLEAGPQPSQKNLSSDGGSLAASVEAGMLAEQSDSTGKEPLQPLASAAAGHASSAVSSTRREAWTLGHTTVPRRLPPLTLSRQGTAGPTSLLSGDWVSCHTERTWTGHPQSSSAAPLCVGSPQNMFAPQSSTWLSAAARRNHEASPAWGCPHAGWSGEP